MHDHDDDQVLADGRRAHAAGHPMSACPFLPSDPAGGAWRSSWISAEAEGRYRAGTYGASDEDYARAGLKRPAPRAAIVGAHLVVIHHSGVGVVDLTALSRAADVVVASMNQVAASLSTAASERLAGVLSAAWGDATTPPPPTARHRTCPRHGDTSATAGMCRPCSRGA